MNRVAIVVVGSEILMGIVQDTNSRWLAKKLTELGFEVRRVTAVPDSYEDIEWAVKTSLEVADVVIVTGGLGFTEDDVTVAAVARALGLELVLNQEAVEMIRRRIGGEPTYQLKAAYMPRGSKPLYNPVGVSPGVYLEINGKHLFLLPGVPAEMKALFENEVKPLLEVATGCRYTRWVTVVTLHDKETVVDNLIRELRVTYKNVYFKTHASTPVKISVLISATSKEELEELTQRVLEDLRRAVQVQSVE